MAAMVVAANHGICIDYVGIQICSRIATTPALLARWMQLPSLVSNRALRTQHA